jgi:hypothetical protein
MTITDCHTPPDTTTDPAPAEADTFTVIEWRDPVVENAPGAIPTWSDDALIWWTPLVGPTGMLIAHRFAAYASQGPTSWTVAELSATFGMGRTSRTRVEHALDRLVRFGIINRHGSCLAVRTMLAPLNRRQRAALPDYLRHGLDA